MAVMLEVAKTISGSLLSYSFVGSSQSQVPSAAPVVSAGRRRRRDRSGGDVAVDVQGGDVEVAVTEGSPVTLEPGYKTRLPMSVVSPELVMVDEAMTANVIVIVIVVRLGCVVNRIATNDGRCGRSHRCAWVRAEVHMIGALIGVAG
eukprot:gene27659-34410_t